MTGQKTQGFTLIELSIVLVIIGLIVGGVLAGQALIKSAERNALLSQIEQFKVATTSFKDKYSALPGDMLPSKAARLGFFTFTGVSAGGEGFGNNNYLLDIYSAEVFCGQECGAFWRHLSDAGLLSTSYGQSLEDDTGAGAGVPTGQTGGTPLTNSLYMPKTKGSFGYIGVGSIYYTYLYTVPGINTNTNFYYIQTPSNAARNSFNEPSLSAVEAYIIDLKSDDGKPNTGRFMVNTWEDYAYYDYIYWATTVDSTSNACTTGGADAVQTDVVYNANPGTGGDRRTCVPIFLW